MPSPEERKLAETVAALESRLAAVEDVQAIQNLKSRYGQLADSRYHRDQSGPLAPPELDRIAREIAELFSENAVWDGGSGLAAIPTESERRSLSRLPPRRLLGVCRGREEIFERFRKPTLQFSWHFFVKPQIQVEGDVARATWDILAPCTSSSGRPMWMAGTEDDEYVRHAGKWLHSAMRLSVVFMAPHDRGWGPPA